MTCVICVVCSSKRRHTRCELGTGVQTCALPIGSEIKLTLVEIVGLKELAEALPPDESQALMGDVGALLRGKSLGGDTASRIDPEKYGIPIGRASCRERVCQYA